QHQHTNRGVGVVADLMRAFLAARKAHDVAFLQDLLALVRAERRPAAQDDHPLLVRVVRVVRPEPIARHDLVHAAADQLGADVLADPGVLAPPALTILGAVPLVPVEVEDLHGDEVSGYPEGSSAGSPLIAGAARAGPCARPRWPWASVP